MPKISANTRVLEKAINGPRAVYAIEGHPGLYLDVYGPGAAWRLRYRPRPKANQVWFTLAPHAKANQFDDIKKRASDLLHNLRLHGVDPRDAKLIATTTDRSLQACFLAWLDHTGKRRERPLAPRTRAGYETLFRLHVAPRLGALDIAQLDRTTIETTLARVRHETTNADKNHRGVQATKVLKMLSSICEWAADQEWIARNPCRAINKPVPIAPPDGKQSRPPSNAELRQLWNEAPRLLPTAQIRVLRLAILTGRRISEISGARFEDLRLDAATPCLFIPASREGNKPKLDDAVPLAPLALAIVKDALGASSPGQPLFLGAATRWTTSKSLTMLRRVWNWPAPIVRFHDFRGLINDQMAALGVPVELRSRTLHHTGDLQQLANTTYSAYDFQAERLRALSLWEARLREIVSDTPTTSLQW